MRPLALVVFVAALAAGCGGGDPTVTLRGETMGTTWTVKYHGAAVDKDDAQAAITETLAAVNAALSTYDDRSEISRLNEREAAG